MIKNIIFDLGNVLIKYSPENFMKKYVAEENREEFFNIVFKSKEWGELDRGTLTYEEATEIFSKRIPEEKKAVEKLFENKIMDCLSPIENNIAIMRTLKKNNYSVYILSNFHQPAFEYIKENWDFIKEFNGEVVSCYCHYLKPQEEIYQLLLKKYNLNPKETLFIDDTKINVTECEKQGIKGVHLYTPEILKELLEKCELKI